MSSARVFQKAPFGPDLPNAEVVSASVYQARGRLNGYPDPEATQIRRTLAERGKQDKRQSFPGNLATDRALHVLNRVGAG